MDLYINEIIKTEKKACELVRKAIDLKKALPDIILSEKDKMKKNYFDRAIKKITQITEADNEFLRKKCSELEEKRNMIIEKMESSYKQNKDKWVDILYNNIFGG